MIDQDTSLRIAFYHMEALIASRDSCKQKLGLLTTKCGRRPVNEYASSGITIMMVSQAGLHLDAKDLRHIRLKLVELA